MDSNLTVNACIGIFDAPALRQFVELACDALEQVAVPIVQEVSDGGPEGKEARP